MGQKGGFNINSRYFFFKDGQLLGLYSLWEFRGLEKEQGEERDFHPTLKGKGLHREGQGWSFRYGTDLLPQFELDARIRKPFFCHSHFNGTFHRRGSVRSPVQT